MSGSKQRIEKIIFDGQVQRGLETLAINYRPREPYAYLLGCLRLPRAYVYDFIHDAAAQSTSVDVNPDTNYLIRVYSHKKSMLPETRLDFLSWFHAHPIDFPSGDDIRGQRKFGKIYKPSFATIMNYNTLEMRCFDVDDNDIAVIIPHEIRAIPQEIRKI